jgi:hypothetical protein
VADTLRLMRERLRDRIDAPRWWTFLAFQAPRGLLAVVVAAIPGAVLLAAALLGPRELLRAITGSVNVHDTFSRFVSAVATTSAIAVSIASLSFRSEMRGLERQERRTRANAELRARVRRAAGALDAPVALGPFLAFTLRSLRDAARRVRRGATREELETEADGVRLGEFLDTIEIAATRSAAKVEDASRKPTRLAAAALDIEEEVTGHVARRFARDERLAEGTRHALEDLLESLSDLAAGAKYAKTLGMSYGMGAMSLHIALATIPAIATAAFMVLAYGDGAVAALGRSGAAVLVALAFSAVLYPLGVFVSYIVRFLFLNQRSLPTDGFVLGPEEPEAVSLDAAKPRSRSSARPGGGEA